MGRAEEGSRWREGEPMRRRIVDGELAEEG